MSLLGAIDKQKSLLETLGKAGLNSLFPNDFELYVIAFELLDSLGNTIEFFSMPIMPDNITISETEIVNVKKTSRGVVSIKTESFVPKDISISGNFGRNLKVLVRNKLIDFKSFKTGLGLIKSEFEGPIIKTGYGSTKVLQNILNGSKVLDRTGNPTKLYFYNYTFNDNYIVEVMDKTFSQSKDTSNLIWNYSVNLKAVAPINNDVLRLKSIVASSVLQKGVNDLASNISRSLPKTTTKNIFSS